MNFNSVIFITIIMGYLLSSCDLSIKSKISRESILKKTCTSLEAELNWNENTESDLSGYKVYWGTQSRNVHPSGGYDNSFDVGQSTTYTIKNLQGGTQYYFAVTAYDRSGNESDFSEEQMKSFM